MFSKEKQQAYERYCQLYRTVERSAIPDKANALAFLANWHEHGGTDDDIALIVDLEAQALRYDK